jgi:hypothetical protein
VALAGLTVVLAVGAVTLWPPSASRITRENFNRIVSGMSRAEVEAILGPPGDYRTGPTSLGAGSATTFRSPEGLVLWWEIDTGALSVTLDRSDRVVQTGSMASLPPDDDALRNFLWRAKRQWRRWFP